MWGLALFREVSRCPELGLFGHAVVVARSSGLVEVVARSWGSLWVPILCVCVGRLALPPAAGSLWGAGKHLPPPRA